MKKIQTKDVWLFMAQVLLLSLTLLSPGLISYVTSYSSFLIFALLVNLMAIGIALSIRYVMRQSEKKQKEVEAELAWLKNQINPHFLFNTLNR